MAAPTCPWSSHPVLRPHQGRACPWSEPLLHKLLPASPGPQGNHPPSPPAYQVPTPEEKQHGTKGASLLEKCSQVRARDGLPPVELPLRTQPHVLFCRQLYPWGRIKNYDSSEQEGHSMENHSLSTLWPRMQHDKESCDPQIVHGKNYSRHQGNLEAVRGQAILCVRCHLCVYSHSCPVPQHTLCSSHKNVALGIPLHRVPACDTCSSIKAQLK